MLQLYPSNKTESLAYLIAEIIDRHPLSSPFAQEMILIQSQGMGTWLQQELSTHSGIASLIDCKMPASFVWKLAEQLMPDQKHIPLFEKNNVRWEIFKQLPEKLADPKYQVLKDYLQAQSKSERSGSVEDEKLGLSGPMPANQQKVLFELSSVIADVFDAYQNYRPDWIELWEAGKSILDTSQPELAELESWQADLWRSVYPDIALEHRQHRSRLFAKLIDLLRFPSAAIKQALPERLFIFGLSALPPQWLPLMTALGQHIDIHFLVHNPCQYYWGDVLTEVQQLKLEQALVAKGVSTDTAADTFLEGNVLLASWGKLGRDYISLLSSFPGIEDVPTNLFDDSVETGVGLPTCALHLLQTDLLNLQSTEHALLATDDSIRFSSCHSHLREVEALHDYLFTLLNQHPEISPKDIIVMMPDVQDFAALIEAVFSRPAYDQTGQAYYLPYGISDQLLSMDQPLLDSLSGLLNLSSSRVTGADLLDWLEMPAIRSRFAISETEMEDLKEWIHQLNIRWGLSESHRDQLLQSKHSGKENTWLSACRRLLAGYIFGQVAIVDQAAIIGEAGNLGSRQDELLAFPQRSPERQVLAGKLMRFLDVIESSILSQSKQYALSDWLIELSALWQSWLDFELVSSDIQSLLSGFETALEKEIAFTGFDQPVSFSVISSVLKTQFENQRISQRFLAGRINFCTLMPMRSIPFKVVCMLGLNEGSYPRPVQGQSFDLLTLTPSRVGDRSRREDDRYLFLEALCSARSHLYISYCGRDIQDNSERFPSVLVSELQSYCARYFSFQNRPFQDGENILDSWISYHYLQPFHPSYFYSTNSQQVGISPETLAPSLVKTFATEWLPLMNNDSGESVSKTVGDEESQRSPYDEEQFDLFGEKTELFEEKIGHAGNGQSETKFLIPLTRLLECVSHPLRYYSRTRLQVNYREIDDEMLSSEPFSVQGLSAYDLKKELAQTWFEQADGDSQYDLLVKHWQLAGKLPRAPLDQYYVDSVQASLSPMHAYLQENLSEATQHNALELTLEPYQISGHLLTVGDQFIELSLSKNMGSSFFSFWAKHVLWSVYLADRSVQMNIPIPDINSRLIGPESEIIIPLLAPEQAKQFAFALCEFFEQASIEACVFLPKTAFALLFESESKAKTAFQGTQYFAGENTDPYWQRFCLMHKSAEHEQHDWQSMPDLSLNVFFQQISAIKGAIQIKKVALNEVSAASKSSDKKSLGESKQGEARS